MTGLETIKKQLRVGPANLAVIPPKLGHHQKGKLKSPSAKVQAAGVSESGHHKFTYEEELIQSIHSASIFGNNEIRNHATCCCKEP